MEIKTKQICFYTHRLFSILIHPTEDRVLISGEEKPDENDMLYGASDCIEFDKSNYNTVIKLHGNVLDLLDWANQIEGDTWYIKDILKDHKFWNYDKDIKRWKKYK